MVINENVTLTIDPGTKIEFEDYYHIEVLGNIVAEGSSNDRIIFTSVFPEDFEINDSHRGCWNGIRFPYTSAVMDNSIFEYCIFEYSKSTGDPSMAGGAISCRYFSKLKIENCIFRNNLADRGGAIALRHLSAPALINNLFHDNYALEVASVIYNEYSYPLLLNNTFTQNHSINEDIYTVSSTITNMFSKPVLSNNIIWENFTAYFLQDEIFEPREYYYGVNQINQEGLNTENIFEAPDFEEDYSLAQHSAGINSGESCYNYLFPIADLAGNPRICEDAVDTGCFEFYVADLEDDVINADNSLKLYPNPFNPIVNISYFSESADEVYLEIFDIKGRRVYFINKKSAEGKNQLSWDGNDSDGKPVSSGVYLFRVKGKAGSFTGKACLLK